MMFSKIILFDAVSIFGEKVYLPPIIAKNDRDGCNYIHTTLGREKNALTKNQSLIMATC